MRAAPRTMAGVRVRPARAGDLADVADLERRVFSLPWTPASFSSLLGRERVLFLVAETEAPGPDGPSSAPLLGHGVLWWVADEGELANLAVAPEARRRGVAMLLLEHLLDGAARAGVRSVFLEVRASNRGAVALYRKRGFREVGRRPDYYSTPREDARIFRLDL